MGTVLPVTVDRAKPERLTIEWDRAGVAGATQAAEVPTPAPAPAPTPAPAPVTPAPVLTPANPPPAPAPAAPASGGDADVLTRLTKLRDAGVLSPVEFEQQKQRMLG
jgi:hypothetical protein